MTGASIPPGHHRRPRHATPVLNLAPRSRSREPSDFLSERTLVFQSHFVFGCQGTEAPTGPTAWDLSRCGGRTAARGAGRAATVIGRPASGIVLRRGRDLRANTEPFRAHHRPRRAVRSHVTAGQGGAPGRIRTRDRRLRRSVPLRPVPPSMTWARSPDRRSATQDHSAHTPDLVFTALLDAPPGVVAW